MNSFDFAFFKIQKMSICVTELKPNDREQDWYITQLHRAVLLYFLSEPWNSERQKLSNSPEQYLLLLLIMSRELCFNSLQKVFWLQGKKKKIKKKMEGIIKIIWRRSEAQSRQKKGKFPAHGRGLQMKDL